MKKITWVFQNEVGTNLNRYIAKNVATGEEVTFDLLRGGNISIVGTPLNAENLNSLINAINELIDELYKRTQVSVEFVTLNATQSRITWIDIYQVDYYEIELVAYDGSSNEFRVYDNNEVTLFRNNQANNLLRIIGQDGGDCYIYSNSYDNSITKGDTQGHLGLQLVADYGENSCSMTFIIRKYFK